MPTTIKLKNGSGAPTAGDLVQGEPAFDLTNKRLYTEDAGGNVIEVGTNPSALAIAGTDVTATATELNVLDGITATTAELNILDGVTATASELNILDGVTATASELNVLDGITATTTELNYTDGVTSAIQTQLNTKAPIDGATFTGTTTIPTADINGGTIDGATIGATTPAAGSFTSINGGQIGGRRNLIINGAMQVAQRGTSFSAAAPYYSLDRWNLWNVASAQSTDVPTGKGFLNSIQLTVTAQASGNFATIEQKFENEKIVAGRQFTMSFWIKGSASGTAVVRNYSQSNNVGFSHTEFSITTSWQQISVTFTVPTLGGGTSNWCAFGIDFNVNNVSSLSYSGSGVSEPTYTGTVNITGVQLEVGSVATPFEHRSYGEELALCQRYYYEITHDATNRWGIDGLYSSGTGAALNFSWTHPTTMRTNPTFTPGASISDTTYYPRKEFMNCMISNQSVGRVEFEFAGGTSKWDAEL